MKTKNKMTSSNKLKTPVLFLIFNRLETTKKVFEEIRKAKPEELFIAADGPRTEEEKKKTDEVRKYILNNVDWECDVRTLFRVKNKGCKLAVSEAITWFFDNVEQGIILEDDCLPNQDFFRFCEELLERYKEDEKIMHISGTNMGINSKINNSYFFSKISNIWGWATWKRAWRYYDIEMKDWKKYSSIRGMTKLGYSGIVHKFYSWRLLNLTYQGKIDTWDFQWDFCLRKNKGYSIVPKNNLITNIGVEQGTHHKGTKETRNLKIKSYKLSFPLKHPEKIIENEFYSKNYLKFVKGNLFKKVLNKIFSKN